MNRTLFSMFVLTLTFGGMLASADPVNEQDKSTANTDPEITWVGKLVDQACKEKHIDQTCIVTPATERFGMVIDGGMIVPFDQKSNQMAKDTLAGRFKGNVEVTVVGTRDQGAFKLQSIQVNQ